MAQDVQGEGAPRPAGGGGNVFTRKLGPAPLWLWMLGGLGAALALASLRGNKAKQQAAVADSNTAAVDLSKQTPPFIIQNYPGMGVPGPQGPPGTPGTPGPAGPPVVPPAMNGGNPPSSTPIGGPTTPSVPKQPLQYRVKPGDTLTSIAARYGTTWQNIWNYNLDPAHGRPASTIATLKQRGPNLLFSNELILIPQ